MAVFQRNEPIGLILFREKGYREIVVGLVTEADGNKVLMWGHRFTEGKAPEKEERPRVVRREQSPQKLTRYAHEVNYLKCARGDLPFEIIRPLTSLLNDDAWFTAPVPEEEPVPASVPPRYPATKLRKGRVVGRRTAENRAHFSR